MPVEKYIEQHLVRSITRMGGLCIKLSCPGFAGMPDRLILMPGGRIAFAETKAPGKKERPIQCAVQEQLRRLGHTVFSSVDCTGKVQEVLDWAAGARVEKEVP